MKLIYGLFISLFLVGQSALAANPTPNLKRVVEPVAEASVKKDYKAPARSVELCVEKRVQNFVTQKGVDVDEDSYTDIIDDCTTSAWDSKS